MRTPATLPKVAVVALLSGCMEVAARKREQGEGVWLKPPPSPSLRWNRGHGGRRGEGGRKGGSGGSRPSWRGEHIAKGGARDMRQEQRRAGA